MQRWPLPILLLILAITGCPSSDTGGGAAGSGSEAGSGGGAAEDAGAPTYENVSAILGGPEQTKIGACAASSCHGGDGTGKAGLNFKTAKDLTAVLVDVPACENSKLMRVKPGKPDESWLWIKLTANIKDTVEGKLIYDGTPTTCVGVATGFGTRMPQVVGSFQKLSDAKLALIKAWIEDGAPGPK